MTGIEPVVGKIVETGVRAAEGQTKRIAAANSETDRTLLEEAKGGPVLGAAAKAHAQAIAVRKGIVLKGWQWLGQWFGVSQEYFDSETFAADMAERLNGVPEDDIVTPEPSVAVPAIQGLSYSLSTPQLKEMYLQLLASASDARRREDAHPAFADIIRELSPDEAHLLIDLLPTPIWPLFRIEWRNKDTWHFRILDNHLMDLRSQSDLSVTTDDKRLAVWIDNWVRLGLVIAEYDVRIADDNAYQFLDNHPRYAARRAEYEDSETDELTTTNGRLVVTAFGQAFYSVVEGAQPRDEDGGEDSVWKPPS
ncbi:DUF4393 domain-containing protein [Ornithinimicrobium pratense]|uniref:DUF4393 domain-containing protein n=1 Tax=Ornithinimicrobium pratense TaxID=2593973 RepID=A0A5J6V4Z9_9MICO|nr:DUF4393 domain-containing protein [Ornithinimicrobium pratense]QFG69060.1 DUF4393 domain-containing protein [Ornithinimicrobium pratense]